MSLIEGRIKIKYHGRTLFHNKLAKIDKNNTLYIFNKGCSTLSDIKQAEQSLLINSNRIGLEYYNDLLGRNDTITLYDKQNNKQHILHIYSASSIKKWYSVIDNILKQPIINHEEIIAVQENHQVTTNEEIALQGKKLLLRAFTGSSSQISSSNFLPKQKSSLSSITSSTTDPLFVHKLDDGEGWKQGCGGSVLEAKTTLESFQREVPLPKKVHKLNRLTTLDIGNSIELLKRNPPSQFPPQMFSQPTAQDLLVRGKNYMQDGKKVTPNRQLFEVIAIDSYDCSNYKKSPSGRLDHVCSHPENRMAIGLETNSLPPFVFVLVFQIPNPNLNLVVYMAPTDTMATSLFGLAEDKNGLNSGMHAPGYSSMLKKFFLDENDDFRNDRFKLTPRIVEAPWLVRKAVPNKPALLGHALTCRHFVGGNDKCRYLELDIDVGSSAVARSITGVAVGYAKKLVIDLAVSIQGNDVEELPEEVLAVIRCQNIDLKKASIPISLV